MLSATDLFFWTRKLFNETKNIDAAIEAAKWTDDNGYKHTSYFA